MTFDGHLDSSAALAYDLGIENLGYRKLMRLAFCSLCWLAAHFQLQFKVLHLICKAPSGLENDW